jgi:hypothetical protein
VLTATTRAQIRYLWYGNDVHLLAWGKGRHPEHEPSLGRSTSERLLLAASRRLQTWVDYGCKERETNTCSEYYTKCPTAGTLASLPYPFAQGNAPNAYHTTLRFERRRRGRVHHPYFILAGAARTRVDPPSPPAMTALANQRAGAALALAWTSHTAAALSAWNPPGRDLALLLKEPPPLGSISLRARPRTVCSRWCTRRQGLAPLLSRLHCIYPTGPLPAWRTSSSFVVRLSAEPSIHSSCIPRTPGHASPLLVLFAFPLSPSPLSQRWHSCSCAISFPGDYSLLFSFPLF